MGDYPSLAELDAQRAACRRQEAVARARQALEVLKERGVEAVVVGSLARGDFGLRSDVDFLVLALTHPEGRYALEAEVEGIMAGMPVDVIFFDEVRSDYHREKLLGEAVHGSALA